MQKTLTKKTTPTIHLGSTCLWMAAPGCEPRAAIVTQSAPSGVITVTVFDPELDLPVTKESARHVSDPEFANLIGRDGGVWDFVPETPRGQ